MPKYVSYCPYCGKIVYRDTKDEIIPSCKYCGSCEPLVNPEGDETRDDLWKEAERAVGEEAFCIKAFRMWLDQKYHITDNPLYNKETADYVEKKEDERLKQETLQIYNDFKRREREASKPHCPTCGSTNVKKLDGIDRAVSVGLFGLASNKINKSFKCKNCGYTW